MLEELQSYMQLEQQYTSGVYIKRELEIVRGDGAILYDADGNRYIDCVAGQGTANLGHRHPAIVQAIQEQANRLIACTEVFHNPIRAQYQAALCQVADMPRVFLCNSGAEAVEGALKFARLHTERTGVIAAMRGFHGRTMGALSTTWEKHYRQPFAPLIPEISHVPYNNLERLEATLNTNTAAVLLEVIQGEGGVHPAQAGYLREVQRLCHQYGALLIIDEIQTGFGRTGQFFAFQDEGIEPDLVCLAKSIAGGVPMGAILIGERIGSLPPMMHGSTFGGNPLACAAGLIVIETLQSTNLIERTRQRGEEVHAFLNHELHTSAIREVRGRGLMIGIELRTKVAPLLRALQRRGVLALPSGRTVLRLLPPLVIEDEDLWAGLEAVVEVVNESA